MSTSAPSQQPATAGSIRPEPLRRPWWLARRVLAAAVGIVLLAGGATYVVATNELGKVVEALGRSKAVKLAPNLLAPVSKGSPETLLLIGNDERPPPKSNPGGAVLPHSNEMLLVRIDPSKPTISMLSIPRELQVTFTAPNGEVITNRINSAYTYGFEGGRGPSGGVKLMVETIKRVLGIQTINHVFVTNFKHFEHAVNELGCVYTTVDKRYYHVNEPGGEQYFEINLQPGYQRLCGKQALEFVANRHESTSLIRDARDQRFLLEVKSQYGPSLFENREKVERIFGKAVETDLHGSGAILDLLELLVESSGKPVRQVPFHVTLLPAVDMATHAQIQEAVHAFETGTAAIAKHKLEREVSVARSHHPTQRAASGLALTRTSAEELTKARSASPQLPFAIEYPRVRNAFGGAEPDTLRVYDVRDQHGHLHPSYVIVIDQGVLGQFYDVQGTTWSEPPVLASPSQTVRVGSRTYSLYYTGEKIRTIAWHEGGATYWIENTLTNDVAPLEMLAMAEQTLPVIDVSAYRGSTSLHALSLPPREVTSSDLATKAGAAVGIACIGLLVYLSTLLLRRRRELIGLRDEVANALAFEDRRRTLLATGGLASPAPPSSPPPTAASRVPSPPPPTAASPVPSPPPASAAVPAPAPAPASGGGAPPANGAGASAGATDDPAGVGAGAPREAPHGATPDPS